MVAVETEETEEMSVEPEVEMTEVTEATEVTDDALESQAQDSQEPEPIEEPIEVPVPEAAPVPEPVVAVPAMATTAPAPDVPALVQEAVQEVKALQAEAQALPSSIPEAGELRHGTCTGQIHENSDVTMMQYNAISCFPGSQRCIQSPAGPAGPAAPAAGPLGVLLATVPPNNHL